MDTVSSQDAQLESLKSQLEQATSAEQKAEIEKQIQDLMKVRLRYLFLSLIFVINVPLVLFLKYMYLTYSTLQARKDVDSLFEQTVKNSLSSSKIQPSFDIYKEKKSISKFEEYQEVTSHVFAKFKLVQVSYRILFLTIKH